MSIKSILIKSTLHTKLLDLVKYTIKFGFLPLTLFNLLLCYKYHNIFQYNLIYIKPSLNWLVAINWVFGVVFLPFTPYMIYFYIKEEQYKITYLIFCLIGLDMALTAINLSGGAGIMLLHNFNPYVFGLTSTCLIILPLYFFNKKPTKLIKKNISIKQPKNDLPSSSLLSYGTKIAIHINIEAQKSALIKTLKDFGIDAKIIYYKIGPVVTLHAIEIATGIKSSRIINLSNDIARSMETFSVRIANIPGKNLLGVEISNEKRQVVYFREGIEDENYKNSNFLLPLYLGSNIYGENEIYDLTSMPHLLIAGTTGSGKSVGIHALILSLLFKNDYNKLKLVLIDPKKLELASYQDIPHLLLPVITEAKEAVLALSWVVKEMEKRYAMMAEKGTRNILSYNERFAEEKIPFIIVIIDEMADMMLVAGKEIEISIQRLAQMGRACGIHLVAATQRPSVDVITGTIKANFPTRISFKLATKLDSRTILGDASGAEQLLGSGDMLHLANNGKLTRIHCGFVSESDVNNVVKFWKEKARPDYVTFDVEDELGLDSDEEPYYKEAVALVKTTKKASTSFLQRQFGIGYNRAARIMEQMERQGIVSKGDKLGRHRDVL